MAQPQMKDAVSQTDYQLFCCESRAKLTRIMKVILDEEDIPRGIRRSSRLGKKEEKSVGVQIGEEFDHILYPTEASSDSDSSVPSSAKKLKKVNRVSKKRKRSSVSAEKTVIWNPVKCVYEPQASSSSKDNCMIISSDEESQSQSASTAEKKEETMEQMIDRTVEEAVRDLHGSDAEDNDSSMPNIFH